jgi:hypothetical protein
VFAVRRMVQIRRAGSCETAAWEEVDTSPATGFRPGRIDGVSRGYLGPRLLYEFRYC